MKSLFRGFCGRLALAVCLVGLALTALGCAEDPLTELEGAKPPIKVAVSVPPHQWLVERIGGDRVDVMVVAPEGVDPFTFEPGEDVSQRTRDQRVYFRAGLPCETEAFLHSLGTAKTVQVYDLRDGLNEREGAGHDQATDPEIALDGDPHIWTGLQTLEKQAETIAAVLASLDPKHEHVFLKNLAELRGEFLQTRQRMNGAIAESNSRAIGAYVSSLSYLADEFELEQIALLAEDQAPSSEELDEKVKLAKQLNMRVIFVKPEVLLGPRKALVEEFARRTGAQVHELDTLDANVPAMFDRIEAAMIAK